MQTLSIEKNELIDGVRAFLPIWIPVAVFGLFFGATASDAGLGIWEILLTSGVMYAGASQFVFLEVFGYRVPAWSIILTVFAVNFRNVLYSASLSRYKDDFPGWQKYLAFFLIIDPLMAESEKRAQYRPLTASFYFGYSLLMYVTWLATSGIGAAFGAIIDNPADYGLDLFITIYFLIIVMGFRTRSNWIPVVLASGCASVVFYYTIGPPWHISLGALAGMAAAVLLVRPLVQE